MEVNKIVKKVFKDQISTVYALLHLQEADKDFVLAAPEERNEQAYAYDLNDHYKKIPILTGTGGTMSLIQVPGSLNFLATEKFFPPFAASESEIIYAKFNGESWDTGFVKKFPYLHRFDLVESDDKIYFIGSTITEHKDSIEDWSTPGHLYVGNFNEKTYQIENLQQLSLDLHTNHGYRPIRDKSYSLITAQEGVYRLYYPTQDKDWQIEQLYDQAISDIAPFSEGDKNYYLAIKQFHGEKLALFDKNFKQLYEFPGVYPFSHSLWAGEIQGHVTGLFGHRAGDKNFYEVEIPRELDTNSQNLKLNLLDSAVGSTSVIKFDKAGKEYIASANREIDEFAIYQM